MFSRKAKRTASQKGFTLIELLVVMIILMLLATMVAPRVFQHIAGSKQKAAKIQISLFEGALNQFLADCGRFPSGQEGLESLRKNPGLDHWDGPYLLKDVPPDPWGKPYIYRCPGEHNTYDIVSLGADGADGGEGENADVVSW